MTSEQNGKGGWWSILMRPSAKYSLFGLLVAGFAGGIIFWGGFNTGMEATNTMEFCIGCHEMKDNVYEEYKTTIHYSNRTGVRAVCSDCHVPKDWTHKMIRKVKASYEVWGKLTGKIDTKEKVDGIGFNTPHAAAYSLVAYHTGWLKQHHPAAFAAATM